MHRFDGKTVLLHLPIEKEVYLEKSQVFLQRQSDGKMLVCRLENSTCGLKQAATNCYERWQNFTETGVWHKQEQSFIVFGRIFFLVWVDDIRVASESMTVISDVKRALEVTFHVEDRGRLHWPLGPRTRREVVVDQERSIEKKLDGFQNDECKHSGPLAHLNLKLQSAENGDKEVNNKIHRSVVWSLLYPAK